MKTLTLLILCTLSLSTSASDQTELRVAFGLYMKHIFSSGYKDDRFSNGQTHDYNEGGIKNNRLMGFLIQHDGIEGGLIMGRNSYRDPMWAIIYNEVWRLNHRWDVTAGITFADGYKKAVKENGQTVGYRDEYTVAPQVGGRFAVNGTHELGLDLYALDALLLTYYLRIN